MQDSACVCVCVWEQQQGSIKTMLRRYVDWTENLNMKNY